MIREESEMKCGMSSKKRGKCGPVGGVVELGIIGLPAGVGLPISITVEGRLAYGFYGILRSGVEFGAGFSAALLKGSENNDEFYISEDGGVKTRTNHHGGVLGVNFLRYALSIARMAFKPTPSIGKPQKSIDYRKKEEVAMGVRRDVMIPVWQCGLSRLLRRWQLSSLQHMILEQEESLRIWDEIREQIDEIDAQIFLGPVLPTDGSGKNGRVNIKSRTVFPVFHPGREQRPSIGRGCAQEKHTWRGLCGGPFSG